MKTLMSSGKFNGKLVQMHDSAKLTADILQELLEDAFLQASHPRDGGHGSTSRLTKIVKTLAHNKRLPTRVIQRYIAEHADVKWRKDKQGEFGYEFVNGTPHVVMPEVTWYDWEGNENKTAKVDVDVVKNLRAMLNRINKAKEKGGTVEHEELVPEIKALIRKATAQVHTEEA